MGLIVVKCKSCDEEIFFDPNEKVVTQINESAKPFGKEKEGEEVIAYLTCPNGHTRPYKVKR